MATTPGTTTSGIAGLPGMEQYIPGITANTNVASQNVGNMLTGLPSAGPARTKAAYFGATSGMPNSGVSNALGYDLYNQDAQRYQQQGFDNLLKMLTSYSGTVAPTTGEQQQSSQFNQNLAFQQSEANRANAMRQREMKMKEQDQAAKYAPRREFSGWFDDNGDFSTSAPPVLGAYTNAKGFDWMKDPVTGATTKNNSSAWPW